MWIGSGLEEATLHHHLQTRRLSGVGGHLGAEEQLSKARRGREVLATHAIQDAGTCGERRKQLPVRQGGIPH